MLCDETRKPRRSISEVTVKSVARREEKRGAVGWREWGSVSDESTESVKVKVKVKVMGDGGTKSEGRSRRHHHALSTYQ
jgi:transglutaminase/protease-like cytokinesis protein 3